MVDGLGRVRGTVAIAMLAVAVVSCGTGETDSPAAAVDERMAVYNDPCTMPSAALTPAGLLDADKRPGTTGVEFNGWKGCAWQSTTEGRTFSMYTGPRKLADFQSDPMFAQSYTPVEDTTLGGRPAKLFTMSFDPDRRAVCAVGAETSTGMALFQTFGLPATGDQPSGDMCAEVVRVGTVLIGQLPDADSAPAPVETTAAVRSESDVLAIFGNVDPCTLVTPAEVEQMTGTPGLAPNRTFDIPSKTISCDWGGERPVLQIDFHGLIKDDYTITPPNDRSREVGARIGRAVDLSGYDTTDCMAMTLYQDPRRMVFILIDPPGDEKVEGGVCGRALPTIESVLGERISWP